MTEHFIVQSDNGVLTVSRAKWEQSDAKADRGHWAMYGTVPMDELPAALRIGVKVSDILFEQWAKATETAPPEAR